MERKEGGREPWRPRGREARLARFATTLLRSAVAAVAVLVVVALAVTLFPAVTPPTVGVDDSFVFGPAGTAAWWQDRVGLRVRVADFEPGTGAPVLWRRQTVDGVALADTGLPVLLFRFPPEDIVDAQNEAYRAGVPEGFVAFLAVAPAGCSPLTIRTNATTNLAEGLEDPRSGAAWDPRRVVAAEGPNGFYPAPAPLNGGSRGPPQVWIEIGPDGTLRGRVVNPLWYAYCNLNVAAAPPSA
jgi:hypothetical protein